MKNLAKELLVKPGKRVDLGSVDPAATFGYQKDSAAKLLEKNLGRLSELQSLLYADRRFALLIILQALDAGGKDGTIRSVMSGVNPLGCQVTPFKVPTSEEAEHDFLWRIHHAVPRRGMIGIFNRSHYEDVLVVRVHGLAPKSVWRERYRQINDFERLLTENGVHILKFYLHISPEEQAERFAERVADPAKHWKLALGDFEERKRWDDYRQAYEDALAKCSTEAAPWYVIPADRNWFRNLAVSEIIVDKLESMKLRYPKPAVSMDEVPAEFRKLAEKVDAGKKN